MATNKSKRVKASAPVEEKQIEAPKTKEVKVPPKPVEEKVVTPSMQTPVVEEVKEVLKPVEKKASAKKSSDEYDELRKSLKLRFKGRLTDAQIEHRVNIVKQSKGDK